MVIDCAASTHLQSKRRKEVKRILAPICVGFLLLVTQGRLWAQATAQVSGSVQDQSGAALPGAEVKLTQTDTGVSRMTITNETGYYVLPNLPLGPYKLEASLPGFRSYIQNGIVLQVNSNPTINAVLQVGQVSEQVEVQANAALVETRSLSVGQVMETARIMELPLNGRNAQELLLLNGGAVQTGPAGGFAFPGRLLISAGGGQSATLETTLDGVNHVSPFDALPLPLPFPDALAEFKTEIGGLSAQQGRDSQVNAVTKSGTNDLHGNLFEFMRNDLFNARNYFATKGSTLKRNQFGGTMGGPVFKNKLFFFGGYQGTTLRQDPADMLSFVPTAAMLAGDFTAFASAACNTKGQVALKAPFVNNRIDPALFSPVAVKVAARLPKTDDPCGALTFGRKTSENDGQWVGKIDYQNSAKHSLFARLMYARVETPPSFQFTPDNVLNAQKDETHARAHAYSVGSTYLISATTVNAFRFSFSRTDQQLLTPPSFDLQELGAKIYSGYTPKAGAMSVASGFSLTDGGRRISPNELWQISDDVSMTRGTHQFSFGGRVGKFQTGNRTENGGAPFFNFNGAVTGLGLADFLLGKPNDLTQGTLNMMNTKGRQLSLYAQDVWQVKPRLSVSYGLRWAPILAQYDVTYPVPYVALFDIARYRQGIRSSVFVNAPPGVLFPGDEGFALKNNGANAGHPKANLFNPYWKDFAPRLGFAWDVEGNGRTSLRASYGLSYFDLPMIIRLGTQQGMPPYGQTTNVPQPAGGLDDPWRDFPGGNPFPLFPSRNMPFVPSAAYVFLKPDLSPVYTQNWNLSLQREAIKNTLLSVSYIGSQTIHLEAADPINQAIFVPGVGNANGNCFLNGAVTPFKVTPGSACSTVSNTPDRRTLNFVNPAFASGIGSAATIANGGTQQYHGMILSVQRRAREFTVNSNYTLSHCIGDYQARTNSGYGISVGQWYQDPNNRRRDRGNCEIDQRHSFNLTAVAETPRFANRTLTLVGSGWRLSGIYRIGSGGTQVPTNNAVGLRTATLGAPSAATTSAGSNIDRCLCDSLNQRPDQILGNVYLDTSGRPGTKWLNPAAFAQPALGTLGNMGRATLRMPVAWQFDMGLVRVIRLRETQSVEFRVEAYNILNSFRSGPINTSLNSAQFGLIRAALDPRIMQFALKYAF